MSKEIAKLSEEDRNIILAILTHQVEQIDKVLSLSTPEYEKFMTLRTKTLVLACYIRSFDGIQLYKDL